MPKDRQWARKWDCCQGCGTTERPHYAKGLCKACYGRNYCQRHPEANKRWSRQYRKAHPGRERERKREYAKRNKERDREYHRERTHRWRVENRQRVQKSSRQRCAKRRAIAKGLLATLTTLEWETILERHSYACAYCGTQAGNLQQEHIVPMCQGGGYTKQNIVPACPVCNLKKGARTPKEAGMQLIEAG